MAVLAKKDLGSSGLGKASREPSRRELEFENREIHPEQPFRSLAPPLTPNPYNLER